MKSILWNSELLMNIIGIFKFDPIALWVFRAYSPLRLKCLTLGVDKFIPDFKQFCHLPYSVVFSVSYGKTPVKQVSLSQRSGACGKLTSCFVSLQSSSASRRWL